MFLAMVLFLAGCHSKPDGDQAYISAWSKVMTHYEEVASNLPNPNVTPSMTREQKKAELVRVTTESSNRLASLVGEAEALHPSPKVQELNRLTVDFFKEQSRLFQNYADAMANGTRAESDAAGEKIDKYIIDQMKRIIDELGNLGADAKALRDKFEKAIKGI